MKTDFFNFLQEIGFDKSQTRIEKYRLDGTSNYLISLNNSGVTWAVSIRIPAMGIEYEKFEKEKKLAVRTAEFMSNNFSTRTNVSNNVSFLFDGKSMLSSYDSIFDFFKYQNSLSPLKEIDNISGQNLQKTVICKSYPNGIDDVENIEKNKKEEIKNYFSNYKGSFFVSKGAPASETLDNYFNLVMEAVKSLAVLHSRTGLTKLLPINTVISKINEFDSNINQLSECFNIPLKSSSEESFKKYLKKWNKEGNPETSKLIRKEIILRTPEPDNDKEEFLSGKKLLSEFITKFENELQNQRDYSCFTHNDPHSENFIIVEYLYVLEQKNHQYMDREFLNKLYSCIPENINDDKISIEYIGENNTLLYRKYNNSDIGKMNVNIVNRFISYDIHLIDIDDATGIEPETRRSYLYDLFIFAISALNLSMIKNKKVKIEDIIYAYYDFFKQQGIDGEYTL